jgi:hypothetical protein
MMTRHYVTYYMPGTLMPETTSREVDSWDSSMAREKALRTGWRRPFCFEFTTRERQDDEFDSRETARSKRFYLGGEVIALADIPATPEYSILRLNISAIPGQRAIKCITENWQPFFEGDTLLEEVPWTPA